MEQRIEYVLTTGGNWALGTIGDFKLTIDKGEPDNLVSFCGENVRKTGPTTFEMTAKDYYPERDIEILILHPFDTDAEEPTASAAAARRRYDRRAGCERASGQQGLMDIAIFAAVAENGVIGRDDGLPWRLSSDMKRFKAGTMGKPAHHGPQDLGELSATAAAGASQHRDQPRSGLPRRGSRSRHLARRRADARRSARARCMAGADEICIIGGGEIYRQAIGSPTGCTSRMCWRAPRATRDFPQIDPAIWKKVSAEDFPAGEKDSHATRYVVYARRGDRRSTPERLHSARSRDQMPLAPANRAGCSGGRVESALAHPYKGSTCEFRPFRRRPEAQRKEFHALEQSERRQRRPVGRRRQQWRAVGPGPAAERSAGLSSRSRGHHPPRPGPAAARAAGRRQRQPGHRRPDRAGVAGVLAVPVGLHRAAR